MRIRLPFAACLLFGLALPAISDPVTAVEVTASALNVRTGASTQNGRIGLVRRGQVYPALDRAGSWVKIQLGSRSGWAHGDYLRNSSRPINYVTASTLNVRSGASSRYRILGTLSRGTAVAVAGNNGSWRKIAFNGRDAYVHGRYLSSTAVGGGGNTGGGGSTGGNRPRSRAGFIQLPNSGPGFFGYYAASKRWGLPRLVYGIERVAARYMRAHPTSGRVGIGDISAMNGGRIAGHASHRRGVDVDGSLMRSDAGEGRTTIFRSTYSRSRTQTLLTLYESELNITHIFFNDTRVRTPHRQNWPNHDNHYHIRIR